MSPTQPKTLRSPPTLSQVLENLEQEKFLCLGHPLPNCHNCKELPDYDREWARESVQKALDIISAGTSERSPSSHDLTTLLRSIATNLCCTNHQEASFDEDFANYWMSMDKLKSILRSHSWHLPMGEWRCLGSSTSNPCCGLRKKWSPSERDDVFRTLNMIAVAADSEPNALEELLNHLVEFWTCRKHRANKHTIHADLLKTFNSSSSTRRHREITGADISPRRSTSISSDSERRSRSNSVQSVSSSLTSVDQSGDGDDEDESILDEDDGRDPGSPCSQRGRSIAQPTSHAQVIIEEPHPSSIHPSIEVSATPRRPAPLASSTSAHQIQMTASDASLSVDDRHQRSASQAAASANNSVPRSEPITFLPFHALKQSFGAIAQSVFSLVQKPITVSESPSPNSTDGYIYIFQSPDYPKYIKIGRTTQRIDERRNQISGCKNLPKLQLKSELCYGKVSNLARLENLIHTDLANERRCFNCPCKKPRGNQRYDLRPTDARDHENKTRHREWFEMSVDEACQRIEQWRNWMRQNPYGTDGKLKEHFRRRISYCERRASEMDRENTNDQRWKTFMTPFYMDD
ncbi:MAG: hypothetical protein Q9191_001564 [Dirinaria sp. TL-2023a]